MSATNRGAKRVDQDFYPTPDYAINSLLEVLSLPEDFLFVEPCKGTGAIYDKVEVNPKSKSYAELTEGLDYFDTEYYADIIITNPPFSLALEFLRKSLAEGDNVFYLLRLNFLGSQARKRFWNANPPTHLLVLSKRPSFVNGKTDATEYAWFGWVKDQEICTLPPGIHVL